MKRNGFTLIELLLVVAIIAILGGHAVAGFVPGTGSSTPG